eukprot:217550_1
MISWYNENGCVNVDELQPVWLIILFCAWQIVKAVLIYYHEPTDRKEVHTYKSCCDEILDCFQKIDHTLSNIWILKLSIMDYIKGFLTILSIVNMIITSIFDIMAMTKWINDHSYQSKWHHFLCMGVIIFSSSNFKSVIFMFTPYVMANHSNFFPTEIPFLAQILWIVTIIYVCLILPWILMIFIPSVPVMSWLLLLFAAIQCVMNWFFMKVNRNYVITLNQYLQHQVQYKSVRQQYEVLEERRANLDEELNTGLNEIRRLRNEDPVQYNAVRVQNPVIPMMYDLEEFKQSQSKWCVFPTQFNIYLKDWLIRIDEHYAKQNTKMDDFILYTKKK